ncbi:MAG: phosphonate C-P lyase system protein PhnH [Acidimicrobiia bacterium]
MAPALEILDSSSAQQVFRTLLDTLAQPGTVKQLTGDLGWSRNSALLPVLCLADIETSLHVITDDPVLASATLGATDAKAAAIEEADIVVALRAITAEQIGRIKRGSAAAPENGARVVLACHALGDPGVIDETGVELALRGPGVDGIRVLKVAGLDRQVFEAIARANDRFPCGIDVHLITPTGLVAALSRSTTIDMQGVN